jgi:hypothetical protein
MILMQRIEERRQNHRETRVDIPAASAAPKESRLRQLRLGIELAEV